MVLFQCTSKKSESVPLIKNNISSDEFQALDICKIVMAILVISIHCPPLEALNPQVNWWVTQYIARFAVPFFFLCSGFFIGKKKDVKNAIKVTIKKTLVIYVVWTLLYSPFIFLQLRQSKNILNASLLICRNIFFVGSYHHLWYILAVIQALILLYIMLVGLKMQPKMCTIICIILYIVGALINENPNLFCQDGQKSVQMVAKGYTSIFQFPATRNGIFFGLPCIYFGIRLNSCTLSKLKNVSLLLFFTILSIAETAFIWKAQNYSVLVGHDFYLGTLPVVYALFCLLKRVRNSGHHTKSIRKISTVMYYIHPWCIFLCGKIVASWFNKAIGIGTFSFFCVCVIITIVLSNILVESVQRVHQNFK